MAIIIPSKNIYSHSHSIINRNKINSIEVNITKVSHKTSVANMVYSGTFDSSRIPLKSTPLSHYETKNSGLSYNTFVVSYVMSDPKLSYDIEIYVPITEKNSYVKEVQSGVRADTNEPWIDVSITGQLIKRRLVGTMTVGNYGEPINAPQVTQKTVTSTDNIRYSTPSLYHEHTQSGYGIAMDTKAEISPPDESNIRSVSFTKKNNPSNGQECFYTKFSVYTGINKEWLGGSTQFALGSGGDYSVYLSGEGEEYVPQYIEVTAYGDTVGIEIENETLNLGMPSVNSFAVDSNELMQESNYTHYENTLSAYENGKETAVVLCSFSEYFDNGVKVISANQPKPNIDDIVLHIDEKQPYIDNPLPFDLVVELEFNSVSKGYYTEETIIPNGFTDTERFALDDESVVSAKILYAKNQYPMGFNISDIVIPMAFGADGQDRPMSLNQDGTPKTFQVVGVRVFYDGAVWQELSLQEV